MDKTVVRTPATSMSAPAAATAKAAKPAGVRGPLRNLLAPLASLRLTVWLFVLSVMLVFFGTLAQVDAGIWTVVNQYFRSALVWVPLQILVRFGQVFFGIPVGARLAGSFPFPGGWLIGGVLLANLLAAHAVRFRMTWKRSGILLIHSGLIVMMLSELIAGLFAIEGNMTIEANGSSNYLEHHNFAELAIIDPSDSKVDNVVVVPGSILRQKGLIHHDALPFDIQVEDYMVNSAVPQEVPAGANNPATAGDGRSLIVVERPEGSGVDAKQRVDVPSAYVTLKEKGTGRALGTYLVSVWFSAFSERPQQVTVDGKSYEVYLRFKRSYKPYTVSLIEFHHEVYPGTDTPKDFSSHIRLVDPVRQTEREVRISMNDPLRYAGETFYQSSFLEGDRGTILQVVRNPGWLMPYLSCAMVSLGMVVHFGMHLVGFLRRRMA
jgi:hypothetical protein